jgi:hypothetical protein
LTFYFEEDIFMQQLLDEHEMIGKVIEKIVEDDNGDLLYFVFSDSTFAGIKSESDYDGGGSISLLNYRIGQNLEKATRSEISTLVELGIFTSDEAKAEIQRREKRVFESTKESELAQLQRLLKKYPEGANVG